ncbi:MAG TPA: hypothetical protein VFT74_20470, partial [Isosphaeraceae bacterium]|nr:hypothetical protein [Isosphaeraceae bacterium]
MSIPEPRRDRRGWVALALLLALVPRGFTRAADRIVLRNTRVISDRSVVSFDPDGVRLSGRPPMILGWDEIEQARLENAQEQTRFQTLLKQLGDPLYRIRLRLKTGDYRDIAPLAEALLPVYKTRRSNTAYVVFQGLFWSRLAQNRRAEALVPYIYAVECLRSDSDHAIPLPGDRQPRVNLATGLSPDLPPVWFDPESAKRALPEVNEALRTVKEPVLPGLVLSVASLALEAGESAEADRLMAQAASSQTRTIQDLLLVLRARRALDDPNPAPALESLGKASRDPEFSQRPLALYWLGLARSQAEDPDQRRFGVLDLLTLPAAYGDDQPELAAAGLYQGWKTLESLNDPGSAVLRTQLSRQYASTVFGQKLAAELESLRKANPESESGREQP